ncbi:ATP-dependent Lon protease [uncultured virus]|nr:ATP-dependent Lon protease [uncultured virus]
MTNILIKDYKVNNLQKEYNGLSILLNHMEKHIERCLTENILNIIDRNNYLKILNDMVRQMNTIYNNNMVDICGNDSDNLDDQANEQKLIDFYPFSNIDIASNCSLSDIRNCINVYRILDSEILTTNNEYDNQILKEPFIEIKKNLLNKICNKIGFYNIDDGLILLIGEQYEKFLDENINERLYLFKEIFVPLKFEIKKIESKKKLFFSVNEYVYETILENTINLNLQKINDKKDIFVIFNGYINFDPLNIIIRTSQICNNFIYKKKKNLEIYLSKKTINEKFIKSYVKNSPLSNFIILNKDKFFEKMEKDYNKYQTLNKLTFMNLMKEFIRNDKDNKLNIKHMFKIIKLLLLGSEENINVAGLLFGIAKEKKPGELTISDIIFKNLSYHSQIKLKKSSISIKNELEKLKSLNIDDIDLKKQIVISKNMPNSAKKYALEKIEEMKSSNNEYYKQLLYVKTLLNFPWPSDEDDQFYMDIRKCNKKSQDFLNKVINILDEKVYGHEECKNSIKELIGQWISNPSSSGTTIGLVGPPGVGKTLIAKAIGDSLEIPFVQITLGGQNDGELLHGHGYTYSGAQPGMIIKKMVEAGSARCIMYFDELDKACKKHDSNEIYNILIHMIDPNTNKEFQDRFFQEISFPLNKVLFIFSYNDSSLIDNILMDRIKEIEVKPYKLEDKKIIAKKFLIREMCKLVGFENEHITLKDDDLEFIIEQYTYEAGVRELKRKLESLFLKLNIDKIYKTNMFENKNDNFIEPIFITKDLIQKYLGKKNINIQIIHNEDLIGVINGLYATDSGKGGILPIQIFNNFTGSDDKFTLKLTGSQRRIMRESVISAFTAAIHIVNEDIRTEFMRKNPQGMHIHATNSASPKNGPSGGSVFATGFISRILNKKIRHDIAMTGEIELTGKITKIGGLQYKLTGAKKAGVKLCLVPLENKEDIEQIKIEYKDLIDDTFEVKLVDNLFEILPLALIDFDSSQIINKIK